MTKSKLETAVTYIIAAIILGCMVYYTPLLFIGLLAGYALGKYKDDILDWLSSNDDPFDE